MTNTEITTKSTSSNKFSEEPIGFDVGDSIITSRELKKLLSKLPKKYHKISSHDALQLWLDHKLGSTPSKKKMITINMIAKQIVKDAVPPEDLDYAVEYAIHNDHFGLFPRGDKSHMGRTRKKDTAPRFKCPKPDTPYEGFFNRLIDGIQKYGNREDPTDEELWTVWTFTEAFIDGPWKYRLNYIGYKELRSFMQEPGATRKERQNSISEMHKLLRDHVGQEYCDYKFFKPEPRYPNWQLFCSRLYDNTQQGLNEMIRNGWKEGKLHRPVIR